MNEANARENILGIGFIVIAMAGFAVEDAIIKQLTSRLSPGQIMVMIGLGGTLGFYILARYNGQKLTQEIAFNRWVVGRTLSELVGTGFFVLSLAMVPITTISAIIQVSPLLVTLGAAVLLREKVGVRRWSAIMIGLLGVVIILRPWSAEFDAAALLAVLGVVGLSARDLATRPIPNKTPSLVLAILGFGATIPAGLILMVFDTRLFVPTSQESLLIGASIFIGVGAYYCIVTAMRLGDVSAVVPFRYSRLVFGVAIGAWYFDETLDFWTVIGSAVVVSSGLYALWRESTQR
ncbi:MAG: DMT family transporter [Planktomarina sp.]|nr:DMT family transporter [Planktomarina sp.]|tara:strand:- start:3655 stop:4530 length:876 start_codon:yes stop_codon:yes gene_type:complete